MVSGRDETDMPTTRQLPDEGLGSLYAFGQVNSPQVGLARHLLEVKELALLINEEVTVVILLLSSRIASNPLCGEGEAFILKELRIASTLRLV